MELLLPIFVSLCVHNDFVGCAYDEGAIEKMRCLRLRQVAVVGDNCICT